MESNTYIETHFSNVDERIKERLNHVYEEVKKNNANNINNYFYNTLDLLCAQYEVFYLAYDSMKDAGRINQEDKYNRTAKNINITVMTRASREILDIMDKLSISPVVKAKVKKLDKSSEETAEELLNDLIS